MLIDAGIKASGKTVVNALKDRPEPITHLDILVASHLHDDHVGGMVEVLEYLDLHKNGRNIDIVLSNSTRAETELAKNFITKLDKMGNRLTVPSSGDSYQLGSATVKVLDACANESNDSLVLLITYRKTRFLFTGDIERNGQLRVIDALKQDDNHSYSNHSDWTSLIKMPHHGAYNDQLGQSNNALYRLLDEYYPSYFVISVGAGNRYRHPHQYTLEMINDLVVKVKNLDWDAHVFRTDKKGDIIVTVLPNGKDLDITTSN